MNNLEIFREEYIKGMKEKNVNFFERAYPTLLKVILSSMSKAIQLQAGVKPAKNVKDYEWLDGKLNDILAQFEHKHITKDGAKNLLYEFIFEDLVNEIQKLKDSPLSV